MRSGGRRGRRVGYPVDAAAVVRRVFERRPTLAGPAGVYSKGRQQMENKANGVAAHPGDRDRFVPSPFDARGRVNGATLRATPPGNAHDGVRAGATDDTTRV